MVFKLGTKYGDYQLQVEGGSAQECMEGLAFLMDAPHECPVCQSGLRLYVRRAGDKQQYRFYGLRCTNEGSGGLDAHEITLGEHNDDQQALFYRNREKWTRVGDVRGGQPADDHEAPQQPAPRNGGPRPQADRQQNRQQYDHRPQSTRRPPSRHSPMHGAAHSQYE